jgi:4-hydroxy-4-methyl-2-oxoglutarate aldolase
LSQEAFMTSDFARLKTVLYSAVLSDTLDALGCTGQVLRPFVRPLDDGLVLMGRARTGGFVPVEAPTPGENPYALEIALVDDLHEGEVAVLACGGPTERMGPWGELLSTAARARGAAGCVTDGLVRDVRQIREMSFPVFHGGIGPLDSKGRAKMVTMDVPVTCGGVTVRPGDIVFGDVDGVVVVPQELADDVMARALDKVSGENTVRTDLEAGASVAETFRKYGIL